MFIERLKGLIDNKSIALDMYSNVDYNDCKSKLNSLVYLLCHLITNNDRSIFSPNREIENIIHKNKDALLLYLSIFNSIISNQQYDEVELNNCDFPFIKDLKGNLDKNTLEGKRIILNQIRNAFAHKTGKVYIYIHNGFPRIRIDNKNWFSIDCDLNRLADVFDLVVINNHSYISNLFGRLIEAIEFNDLDHLNKDISDVLLITLLMCYNKESLMDEYMLTQTTFIDASDFIIKHDGYNDNYNDYRRNFFDKYNMFFRDYMSSDYYDYEWSSIMGESTIKDDKPSYIYDINNMAYDITSKKHIPTPLFLRNLRDACSHGQIEFKNNQIVFYNINPKCNPNLKYYMTISKEDFRKFITSNYFTESILTTMEEHATNKRGKLYNIEQVEASKSFANYMQIFKNKFPNLTTEELILYMYKNNKFSTYLLENPGNEEEFFSYKVSKKCYLWDYIKLLSSSLETDSIVDYSNSSTNHKQIIINYMIDSYYLLRDYVFEFLEDSSIITDNKNKSIKFFTYYYLFLKNLNSTGININDIEESEIENVKSLRRDWFVSNRIINLNMNSLFKTFFAVALQSKSISERNRIALVYKFNRSVFNRDFTESNEKNSLQARKHVYKYSPFNIKSFKTVDFLEKIITLLGLHAISNGELLSSYQFKFNNDEYLRRDIKLTDVLTMYLVNKIGGYISLIKEFNTLDDEYLYEMSKYVEDSVKDKKVKKLEKKKGTN